MANTDQTNPKPFTLDADVIGEKTTVDTDVAGDLLEHTDGAAQAGPDASETGDDINQAGFIKADPPAPL